MTYFMAHIRQKDIFPYIKEIDIITKISEQGNIEFIETILYYIANRCTDFQDRWYLLRI